MFKYDDDKLEQIKEEDPWLYDQMLEKDWDTSDDFYDGLTPLDFVDNY
ncbi:hypothetical protein [Thomasclavelia cocleata]|nr:hypothetical protein [Thomasclavelia cocleata]